MWRKSKQVERTACDNGAVLQHRDEWSEIGPVLTKLAGRGDGVVMPSVQHFALQQPILELDRQVASPAPDVQSLDTKVRELGVLLSCLWWSVASLSWMRISRTAKKQWRKR